MSDKNTALAICFLTSIAMIAAVLLWGRRDADRIITCRPGEHFASQNVNGQASFGCFK